MQRFLCEWLNAMDSIFIKYGKVALVFFFVLAILSHNNKIIFHVVLYKHSQLFWSEYHILFILPLYFIIQRLTISLCLCWTNTLGFLAWMDNVCLWFYTIKHKHSQTLLITVSVPPPVILIVFTLHQLNVWENYIKLYYFNIYI